MTYYSLNQYLKDTFGAKVYKIALDGGFTCPNRDGSLGTKGCIFCSGKGSGDFTPDPSLSVSRQIEEAKQRVSGKIRQDSEGKYIAYFQAFTGTYAPISRLRSLYEEAIRHPDICALSIATRPDCLPDEILELLKEMSRIKPVWVELGLQTIHEKTAEYIRRGYSLPVYEDAVRRLREAQLPVITHVILGLPGEIEEDILETVRYVCDQGISGIKLQLLHVLRGTDLAKDYEAGKFETLTLEAYTNLVCRCLAIIPKDVVIHRMTGDGDKRLLIAPLWSADKKKVLNTLRKAIREWPEQGVEVPGFREIKKKSGRCI